MTREERRVRIQNFTTIRRIMAEAAADCGFSEADIYVRDKSQRVTHARWEAWRRARAAKFTLQAIADVGGWDHSSVAHGVRMANKLWGGNG